MCSVCKRSAGNDALADLQKALGTYPHRHLGTPDGRGIACAILSKHPIDAHADVLDFPQEVLDLGLTELDGAPMTRLGRGVPHVTKNKKKALAILGDFNDAPSAATTQIFQGPDGSEIDTRGFDPPDDGDSARLWNLAPRIPKDRRFSRIHRGQGELLDQIFTSEEYFPRGDDGLRRMPISVDSLVDEIRSIGDNADAASKRVRPDHSPVTAVFEFD